MVNGINFNGNVDKTNQTGKVKTNNSKALHKFTPLWANYFNRFTHSSAVKSAENNTIEDMKGSMSPVVYAALQKADEKFAHVSDRVIQNKNNENLVIKDSDYIPDRQYEEAEV